MAPLLSAALRRPLTTRPCLSRPAGAQKYTQHFQTLLCYTSASRTGYLNFASTRFGCIFAILYPRGAAKYGIVVITTDTRTRVIITFHRKWHMFIPRRNTELQSEFHGIIVHRVQPRAHHQTQVVDELSWCEQCHRAFHQTPSSRRGH